MLLQNVSTNVALLLTTNFVTFDFKSSIDLDSIASSYLVCLRNVNDNGVQSKRIHPYASVVRFCNWYDFQYR